MRKCEQPSASLAKVVLRNALTQALKEALDAAVPHSFLEESWKEALLDAAAALPQASLYSPPVTELREAFKMLDASSRGTLTKEHLCAALTHPMGRAPFQESEAAALIREFDRNSDGVIHYEECAATAHARRV